MEYQWYYQYNGAENGNETFHLKSGYMFEMSNTNHQLVGEGQVELEFNFKMSVSKVTFKNNRYKYNPQEPFLDNLYVGLW